MPFHILLSQSLSLATGGLEAWKIGKDVVLTLLVLFTICLVFYRGVSTKWFRLFLGLGFVYGLFFAIVWLFNSEIYTQSALLGSVYNLRLPAFLLLGFGAMLLNPGKFAFSLIIKIVLAVSALVALFAVVQYFLPPDLLTHLGYSLERGARPAFFIDDHPDLMRAMSSLREPNALGAYLILPIAALFASVLKFSNRKVFVVCSAALVLHLAALFLTFSRSAWIGAALALVLVLWWVKTDLLRLLFRRLWPALLGLLIVGLVGMYSLRNSDFVQQYVIHTSDQATSEDNSTELHFILARQGLEAIIQQPWGYGPGTAGLASIQSDEPQLTENYYIQIGYEVGVLGLGVFIALNVMVYIYLWQRRNTLAIILLSSFWGYVVTNMLLHSWSNEAVAAQWWLLAGAALAKNNLLINNDHTV